MNKLKELIKTIFIYTLLLIVFILLAGKFNFAMVSGHSMDPTLNDGDFLIVYAKEPEDKDIVILTTEGKETSADFVVKRYYAELSDENGYWVEGDNKNNSLDSRKLGTFDKENFCGVAIFDISQFKILK